MYSVYTHIEGDSSVPGLRTPVWAMGPSSMILFTSTCPAAHLMVHPIPFIGSFMRVIRFRPGERGRERERERRKGEGRGRERRESGRGREGGEKGMVSRGRGRGRGRGRKERKKDWQRGERREV